MSATPTTPPSLLARVVNPADAAAWEEFIDVYGPLVLRRVVGFRVPSSDVDDLTQQIFTRIFRGLQRFRYSRDAGRFRDWLGVVIRNEITRYWRTRDRRPATATAPDELDLLPQDAVDPEWQDTYREHVLAVALERTRPHFEDATWRTFVGVWVEQRPASDVAAELGLPVESVYVAKSRVLKALAEEVRLLSELAPFEEPAPRRASHE